MKKILILIAVLCFSAVIGQPVMAGIKDGLEAYWPFEGDFLDASDNGHDGTAREPAKITFQEGIQGQGILSDGTNPNGINCGTWNPSEATGQLSISVWVNWNGPNGGYQGVVSKRNGWGLNDMWTIECNNAAGTVGFFRDGSYPPNGGQTFTVGEWNHYVVSFDGTTVVLYLNGAEIARGGFVFGAVTDATVNIGSSDSWNGFNGAIDEVLIWNRAITAEEVSQLYNNGDGLSLLGNQWKATNPAPSSGTAGILVSEDLVLSWDPPDPANVPPAPITEYDVFFSTDRDRIAEPNGMDAHIGTVAASGDLSVVIGASALARDLTYYWRVDTVVNRAGEGVDPNIAYGDVWWFETEKSTPVISSQPVTNVVDMGGTAHLTVGISSPSAYSVTWYKVGDGVDTQVGTGDTLAIENVAVEDVARYYAVANNVAGDSPPSNTAWVIIRNQLVAYYQCDDDLTAGTTVVDSSAYGHHGAAIGNTASTGGTIGGAITFDGSGSDWVECGRFNPAEGTGEMTVTFWTKWGGSTGTWQSIVSKRDNWGANDMYWQITAHFANQHRVQIETDGSWPWLNQNELPVDAWKHVAITYDGTDARLYFDGTLVGGPAAFNFSNDAAAMVNLGGAGNGGDPYLGALDEVRIYNYALGGEEVAQMYLDDSGRDSVCKQYHQYDFNRNCYVDLADLAIFLANWMNCNIVPDCIP